MERISMNGMDRRKALALAASLGCPVVVVNRWDRFDVAFPLGETGFGESLADVNAELFASRWPCFHLVTLSGSQSQERTVAPEFLTWETH